MNHGTIYGASKAAGKIGGALSFDGVDDYVGITVTWNFPNGASWMAWVKFLAVPGAWRKVLAYYKSAADLERDYMDLTHSLTKKLWALVRTTVGIALADSDVTAEVDRWYHLVGTYDNSNLKIYVDGVLKATTSHSGTILTNGVEFAVGRSVTGEYINAIIDDVRVYNRALSQAEIIRVMNLRGI